MSDSCVQTNRCLNAKSHFKAIIRKERSFENNPLFHIPGIIASLFGSTKLSFINRLNSPLLCTIKGQNGPDFHSGTIKVSKPLSFSSLSIHFNAQLGRGTSQLTVLDQF